MPLHSFDAGDFRGDLQIRLSRQGERIVTLDKVERELPDGAIVISDNNGIFDLLGVMGGLRSSTKETTKRIYLHSASLDPLSIRRTVIATGHRTDAATVYEKGVPPVTTEQGFYRALELFLAHVPGARITSRLESYGENGTPQRLSLSVRRASSLLGRELSTHDISDALSALEFSVKSAGGDTLEVTAPLHRLGDIHEPADLIEEIARVESFAAFEPILPHAPVSFPERETRLNRMRGILHAEGFVEVVRFAFLSEGLLRKTGMDARGLREVANPLGEELKFMRSSLLPRLLECAEKNLGYASASLRLFEVGHVFPGDTEEFPALTLLIVSKHTEELAKAPFFLAKELVQNMLSCLGWEPKFQRSKDMESYMHPARHLCITVNGEEVGRIFEVHPVVCQSFDFPHRAAALTLRLDCLLHFPSEDNIFVEIPAFPAVTYDVTVPLGDEIEVGALLQKMRRAHALLRRVELVDLYQKKGTERRLTFRCTYGAPSRTLTEAEVKPVHEKVEALLRRS